MELPSQPASPLIASTLAVLKAAREQGFEINKTKLAKLLYMADLSAVESGDVPISGATWRWDNYGPYDAALARAEYELADSRLIERRDGRLSDEYGPCLLTLLLDIDDPLPDDHMKIIRDTVRRYGGKTASALRELSYKTAPMMEAQVGGERGVLLDLSRARRRKQVKALLARAKARRAQRPPQETDPGVAEELLAELAANSESIRRANEKVLGDQ
ncbi:Panacea domain-containing protein [Microbispora sp. NBC_01189]|uniref:type II toxin-antitoxin system antitoxin SocA domain-containing protein n=1 Tax=Microbispora sp. NBC_01189 TaxID=2903583 RepID=UPI002E0F594D|nr:Panacea domain-containing protein [Microbispora sp. NBC_01189]